LIFTLYLFGCASSEDDREYYSDYDVINDSYSWNENEEIWFLTSTVYYNVNSEGDVVRIDRQSHNGTTFSQGSMTGYAYENIVNSDGVLLEQISHFIDEQGQIEFSVKHEYISYANNNPKNVHRYVWNKSNEVWEKRNETIYEYDIDNILKKISTTYTGAPLEYQEIVYSYNSTKKIESEYIYRKGTSEEEIQLTNRLSYFYDNDRKAYTIYQLNTEHGWLNKFKTVFVKLEN